VLRARRVRLEALISPLIISCLALSAHGQDTRKVTEPVIPPVCTRLEARMVSVGDPAHIVPANTPDGDGNAAAAARSEFGIRAEDEAKPDTARVQAALDGCGAGKAVELAEGGAGTRNAFMTGPLQLREGVTLLIDKGVTLYGSRDPKAYEAPGGAAGEAVTCGTSIPRPATFPVQLGADAPARRRGCRPLISVDGVKNAAIMGEGSIDGRGYAKIMGHDYSWWQMARTAQPKDDLYYSIRLISANHADSLILYKVHLFNSPNFHVGVNGTNGFTAWGVHLQTPTDKHLDARNTDGIDPGTSENVTVAHSWIDNGDDNIAIKQGVSHMSVLDNHFYSGHGMSIGSETVLGQSYLLVDGLTEDHTTSGIRIKSNVKRGGPVHDLVYENICMRDVPIPIAISPYYTNQTVEPFTNPNYTGDKIPDYKAITLRNIYSESPGDVLIAGLDDAHRTQVALDNVTIRGIKPSQVHLAFADITTKGRGANFPVVAPNVKVITSAVVSAPASPKPCEGRFVPMQ
jgi:polygalacturonase